MGKIGEIGEFGLIDRIRARQSSGDGDIVVGIGDDCAVLRRGPILEVLTTDCLVEGTHFKPGWMSMGDVGWKALAVNVSDVAATGALPRHALVTLFLPDDFTTRAVDEIYDGLEACCKEYGVAIVGGDIVHIDGPFAISIALAGTCERDEIVLRSGARQGDIIVVTGALGEARVGLAYLEGGKREGETEGAKHCIERFRRPKPRLNEARRIVATLNPSSMIDVSDGLLSDLWHILNASGVGAVLDAQAIPIGEGVQEYFGSRGQALSHALSGGEDYEILFTIPDGAQSKLADLEAEIGIKLTRIGTITPKGEGVKLSSGDTEKVLEPDGFDHFRRPAG